jgi:hypothetical protein
MKSFILIAAMTTAPSFAQQPTSVTPFIGQTRA